MKVKSLSCVQPSATPGTAAHQGPPSRGFSRQEHWSGLHKQYLRRLLILNHSKVTLECLLNLYAEYITRNAQLDEAQAGIRIAGRNINNLRYADNTTTHGRKQRRTKEPLDESE